MEVAGGPAEYVELAGSLATVLYSRYVEVAVIYRDMWSQWR